MAPEAVQTKHSVAENTTSLPVSYAITTAWARSRRFSFMKMRAAWVLTVA